MKDLQEFIDEVTVWADATFQDQSSTSKLHHLQKEVKELIEAIEANNSHPEVCFEFADCFILLLQAAQRYGLTMEKLKTVAEMKFKICKERQWGKPDSNGVIEHVR